MHRNHALLLLPRYITIVVACTAALLLLGACSSGSLLSEVTLSAELFTPAEGDQPLTISYRVDRDATVDIYLLDPTGGRYDLRREQFRPADPDPYVLRFDGTAPTDDPEILRRMLSPGDYQLIVAAQAADGQRAEQRLALRVAGQELPLPTIENLSVLPEAISPNADAIDDIAEFTYRLPVTATFDITFTAPDGEIVPFVTRE